MYRMRGSLRGRGGQRMSNVGPVERRRHARGEVIATGVVFSADRIHGTYVVRDLSAGGARIEGALALSPGASVSVLLQLPGRAGFSVAGRVARHDDGPAG